MRVLAVTNMYPSPDRSTLGIFVRSQIESLRRLGVAVDVLVTVRVGVAVRVGDGVGLGVPVVSTTRYTVPVSYPITYSSPAASWPNETIRNGAS